MERKEINEKWFKIYCAFHDTVGHDELQIFKGILTYLDCFDEFIGMIDYDKINKIYYSSGKLSNYYYIIFDSFIWADSPSKQMFWSLLNDLHEVRFTLTFENWHHHEKRNEILHRLIEMKEKLDNNKFNSTIKPLSKKDKLKSFVITFIEQIENRVVC